MTSCASCGAENREEARFCDSCGAPLAQAAPARELRKTVTVLFCDVTGSTALGEQLDPESLRRVMGRYFETAKSVVERHGGTVEKFIGDAVMAVFGVPTIHEDDALRAVRSAHELREELGTLNAELAESYGTRLELRTGVNTGEVVTGTEERLATGDAVNVAARLEQAARPGEVLLGDPTVRLVRDAVEVELVDALELKGKAEPVAAYRLLAVRQGAAGAQRRGGAPMVGRERQRKLLEDAFANVTSERACHLFTVLGTAGVGKSRLVAEFLAFLEEAQVVRGRCLSYGEGISYWPVTEVVKTLLPADTTADPALAPILGDEEATASPESIARAVRKLFEERARERPLIVVFDDIHWGETTFFDLVEHIADLSRDAPILLLCVARPELLDRKPNWGGGKLNATNVLLEPLGAEETGELVTLLAHGAIDEDLRRRILEAAGGNPLFVEEMLAMVADTDGGNAISVPPTIQALLAARLDQLDPAERGVLERGAVEGQVFHRGAVAALDPQEQEVDGRLTTLVRKDLVRPEQALLVGDEAYRFRHLLIRDAAYDALPKASRAELHERFALWLEEHGADLIELDEILGYHLEQAYRYREELGPLDDAGHALGVKAGERLLAGSERSQERGDLTATVGLLGRAVPLLPAGSAAHRFGLLELALVLVGTGEFDTAHLRLAEAEEAARAADDERLRIRVELARTEVEVQTNPDIRIGTALSATKAAAADLERLQDDDGSARALMMVGTFLGWQGRTGQAERVWARALEAAERAGLRLAVVDILTWVCWALWWGPTPAAEGIARCDQIAAQAFGSPQLEAVAVAMRGSLKAMQGRTEEGRADVAAGRALLYDLGQWPRWAGMSMVQADLELLAGDPQAAEESLRGGRELLDARAETGHLATIVGYEAQAALALGRVEDAIRFADEAREIAAEDDFEPHVRTGCVRAKVLALSGDHAGADAELQAGAAIAEPTDYLALREFVALTRADLAQLAGRLDGERSALEEALRLAELKGDVVTAGRARARLSAPFAGSGRS